LPAVLNALPDDQSQLFAAGVRSLVKGDYLRPTTALTADGVPAEVEITEKTHTVLDGWPGASPDELFNNDLAVLAAAMASETDPVRKNRLERLMGALKEVGVEVAGEALSKVLLGGV
jgi:hypothetical protein